MDTLEERRNKHVAIQMYRFVNDLAPTYCSNMFTTVQERHDVNTRSSVNKSLVLLRMNLLLGQRNIRYFGVKVWETVPNETKSADSLENFKNAIHNK